MLALQTKQNHTPKINEWNSSFIFGVWLLLKKIILKNSSYRKMPFNLADFFAIAYQSFPAEAANKDAQGTEDEQNEKSW